MRKDAIRKIASNWFNKNLPYSMTRWDLFDYTNLNKIPCYTKIGRGSHDTYNDVIIGADTETSKKPNKQDNHVVAWTISLRALDRNLVTLYGSKPSHMAKCIHLIMDNTPGKLLYIYWHNLSYDWVFMRKFLFQEFGIPERQLNTKPHYPISIEWNNGLFFKDSLILAQRSLDKWAKDLNVEHQKALGKWDYDKIRDQVIDFSPDELEYIEHDTLALVECIDKLKKQLNKRLYAMPLTATGIPREDVRNIGKEYHAHDRFSKVALTYDQYLVAEQTYHGGYTHANRHLIDTRIEGSIQCYDFASSYPFCLISEKYPSEKFIDLPDNTIDYILEKSDKYAFMFKLVLINPRLKNDTIPMPALQFFKCVKTINPINDNGRILCASYVEINITEIDLSVIASQYDWDGHICTDIKCAAKAYLPRWFTDYVFKCFIDKTQLKGGDPVAYNLAKGRLNSLYGMCCQKCIKEKIDENYITGEYIKEKGEPEDEYQKYLNKRGTILPYQWGIYCTAYAFRNLFELGKCVDYEHGGEWVYSDTDSCYSNLWDKNKIADYNQRCKDKLNYNGYGSVSYNGKEYWLGVAEPEGEYSEFKVMGAKRYCGRSTEDNELHITVSGVPKKGSACLHDDINNFTKGLIFLGTVTNKLTHTYIYTDEIYIDEHGNETGDSIDLSPCDYLLDSVYEVDWESIFYEEVGIQGYEE